MNSIMTNKLIISLDRKKLKEKYEIFKVSTSEKYFSSGAIILDAPSLNNNILSVLFDKGNAFYVLMKTSYSNNSNLKMAISESNGADKIYFEHISFTALSNSIITQLMLNAVSSQKLSFLKFNNLTGHLYVYTPKWIDRVKSNNSYIRQIKCLEYKVNDANILSVKVRTFTSGRLKNKITFKKKTYKDYPKYIMSSANTLRRRLNTDSDEDEFIMRQIDGKRSEIPFLDISSIENFNNSKMGVTTALIEMFNNKYAGLAHIDFQRIFDIDSIECQSVLKKENERAVKEILGNKKIKIINCINDDHSKMFCDLVAEKFLTKYNIKAEFGKRLSKNAYNIRVIHNAAYYTDEMHDPHNDVLEGYSVQHITMEDFLDSIDSAIAVIAHDSIIKNDLINGCISLYNWSEMKFEGYIKFCLKERINNIDRYFIMDIAPDGKFFIKEYKLDLFDMSEYSQLINIFSDDTSINGIVSFSDGSVNIIKETEMFTIPEIFKLKDELSDGNTYLRNLEKRTEYLSSIININIYYENKAAYYSVGVIGYGMHSKVGKASLVRRIEPFGNSEIQFEKLLPLMNIVFVRNGQLTVFPFPFKYLKEYIRDIIHKEKAEGLYDSDSLFDK